MGVCVWRLVFVGAGWSGVDELSAGYAKISIQAGLDLSPKSTINRTKTSCVGRVE